MLRNPANRLEMLLGRLNEIIAACRLTILQVQYQTIASFNVVVDAARGP